MVSFRSFYPILNLTLQNLIISHFGEFWQDTIRHLYEGIWFIVTVRFQCCVLLAIIKIMYTTVCMWGIFCVVHVNWKLLTAGAVLSRFWIAKSFYLILKKYYLYQHVCSMIFGISIMSYALCRTAIRGVTSNACKTNFRKRRLITWKRWANTVWIMVNMRNVPLTSTISLPGVSFCSWKFVLFNDSCGIITLHITPCVLKF